MMASLCVSRLAALTAPALAGFANVVSASSSCSVRSLSALAPATHEALTVFPRPEVGSSQARRARKHGLIPGIIYGPGVTERRVYIAEEVLRKEIHKKADTFLSSTVEITIDGQRMQVLPRDLRLHPFRPKLLSCNWLVYVPGRYPGVRLDIPLKPINEERCPAYKEGGWLLELMYKLPVHVHGPVVPPFLAMDLRGKRLGDKIMASEINLGEGVQLRWRHDHDFAVAKLVGSRRGAEEDAAGAAPGAAAAGVDKAKAGDAKPAAAGAAKAAPAAGGDKKA